MTKALDYGINIEKPTTPNYKGDAGAVDFTASEWVASGGSEPSLTLTDGTYYGRSNALKGVNWTGPYFANDLVFINIKSISFWEYFPSASNWAVRIYLADNSNNRYFYIHSLYEGAVNQFQIRYFNTSDVDILEYDASAIIDQWFHIYAEIDGSNLKVWLNGVLQVDISDMKATNPITRMRFHISDGEGNLDGICINGYPFENYGQKGIFADTYTEYSAKVKGIATSEILDINFSKLDKSQFPIQVRRFNNSLSLTAQIRWLQRCVKENNQFYLQMLDTVLEQINKYEDRIKLLEA